jgi:creatinine amidohydrolase/Fe(II)-dependent formamide hydrolase-like protein
MTGAGRRGHAPRAEILTRLHDAKKGYFGDPAAASREEGEATIAALGEILAEAVLETMLRP